MKGSFFSGGTFLTTTVFTMSTEDHEVQVKASSHRHTTIFGANFYIISINGVHKFQKE